MAMINTSTIENFDSLSDSQKVDALLNYEFTDYSEELSRTKSAFDKTSSDLAEQKRQNKELNERLKGKMTEDEQAKVEQQQQWDELQTKYNDLLRKSTIAEHTAKYLALGYSEKLAQEAATALFDGDIDKLFTAQKSALNDFEKKMTSEVMRKNPRPDGASVTEREPDNILQAKLIGKRKAENLKNTNSIMDKYTIK